MFKFLLKLLFNLIKFLFTLIYDSLYGIITYFVTHIKRWLYIILFAILLIFLLKKFNIVNINLTNMQLNDNMQPDQIMMLLGITLENFGTWFAIVAGVSGAGWAIFQYDKQLIRSKQERAAIVADELSGDLSRRIGIIISVLLLNSDYTDEIKKIKTSNKLKLFDRYEIKDIFNLSNEKELEDFFEKNKKRVYSSEMQCEYDKILNKDYNDEQRKQFPISFELLIDSTLTRLEYLCMNISTNAAGSNFLYPSYHENFLQLVTLLSIIICSKNTDAVDKKYINIIEVFNLWNKKRQHDINKVKFKKKIIEKLYDLIKIIQDLIEKINRCMARNSKIDKT